MNLGLGQVPSSGVDRDLVEIAQRIARASANLHHGGDQLRCRRERDELLEPSCSVSGRHDAGQRTVDRRPRAQPANRPEQARVAAIAAKPRGDFVADLHSHRRIQSLEARQQAPAFTLDLRCDAYRLASADAEVADDSLRDFTLLSCREAARGPLPQYEPLGTVLNRAWKRKV